MPKRPTDYTTQMQSIEEERRLRKLHELEEKKREENLLAAQAQSHGEVVRQIYERGLTIDMHAGILRYSQELLRTNPTLEKEWTALGEDFFRPATQRRQLAETKRATGNGHAGNGDARHGDAQHGDARTEDSPVGPPGPQPPRPRPPASRAVPDLLGGFAPDQTGQSTPAEGGSHVEQS